MKRRREHDSVVEERLRHLGHRDRIQHISPLNFVGLDDRELMLNVKDEIDDQRSEGCPHLYQEQGKATDTLATKYKAASFWKPIDYHDDKIICKTKKFIDTDLIIINQITNKALGEERSGALA